MDDDIAEKATLTSYRILETEVEVVPVSGTHIGHVMSHTSYS